MAASSYELPSIEGYGARKRGFNLARLRAAAFGGGFGLLVVAIGLLLIGIGWNGMAGGGGEVNGVPNLNAQLPWLISGGVLGLALVIFGGAMLVVHNARTDRARLEAKLDEIVTALARGTAVAPAAPVAYPTEVAPASVGVFVSGGATYHRPTCRLVQGRSDVTAVTPAQADSRDLRACRVCKPSAIDTLAAH